MGKPFKKELLVINDTYNWAKSVDITPLRHAFEEIKDDPTFVVGSGGSFSACHMFSALQQFRGTFSKPITPLELHYSSRSIRNSNVVFLSASGRNSDILFAYDKAIKFDAKHVLGICMRKETKLGAASKSHSISKILELDCPSGKDGFLATNSLIAYFAILSRLFECTLDTDTFELSLKQEKEIKDFVGKLDVDFTLTVLYAGWSQPVAIDIESKFTEAGLGNILFSDFRNFGHGRHNWFDKKKRQSAILVLVTSDEKDLAEKTLSLLPINIPKLILSTTYSEATATIDLLIKSFHFAAAVGEKVGIDPGRPGVPPYGSKLYNLRYLSLLENTKKDYKSINAILRKSRKKNYEELTTDEISFWGSSLQNFIKKINKQKFGTIILDYDGTLCAKEERKLLPSEPVINFLNNYASKGFIIGIVTGRGKSVRETLIKCIDKEYWTNIVIGYYNGAIIAGLSDTSQPDISGEIKQSLQFIYDSIKEIPHFENTLDTSLRPLQLTIQKSERGDWDFEKAIVLETIANLQLSDVQILESGHSIDIIAKPEVCKLNIINTCQDICRTKGLSDNFLCIGDKGLYPGNDFELLKSEFSLSVDEVSSDPDTCWNFSDLGNRGVSSCLQYLNSVKFNKSHFTLSL